MIRLIPAALMIVSFFSLYTPQTWAKNPDVLECALNFKLKEDSPVKVVVDSTSTRQLRVLDSGKASHDRWIFLLRLLGPSVSQFSSEVKFKTDEPLSPLFHLKAESGRSFGKVQLFNLEFLSYDGDSYAPHSAKAELVAKPAPAELNSYASLSGDLLLATSDVTHYEINCGPVGWYFGGLDR